MPYVGLCVDYCWNVSISLEKIEACIILPSNSNGGQFIGWEFYDDSFTFPWFLSFSPGTEDR